jgi:hypothetical protein
MLTKQEIQTLINIVGSVQVQLRSKERYALDIICDKLIIMLNVEEVLPKSKEEEKL